MNIIGPLTDPANHGGDPADAFHVVAPSLPGFGFSSPLRRPHWDTRRVARAWAELMHRLGYHRYGAQGGDTGSVVSPELGRIDPEHVIRRARQQPGHLPLRRPSRTDRPHERRPGAPGEFLEKWGRDMSGCAIVQSTRPQTISYALTDSPAGQYAWIVEKFKEWTDPRASLPEEAVDRDLILTDVSMYWLTGTAGSAARIYYEGARTWGQSQTRSPVPTAVAVFPGDRTIRPLAEPNHNVVNWAVFSRGGHFAAMEAPDLLVSDVREFFRQFR